MTHCKSKSNPKVQLKYLEYAKCKAIEITPNYQKIQFCYLKEFLTEISAEIEFRKNLEEKDVHNLIPEYDPSRLIKWQGTEVQLVYLFNKLIDEKLISEEHDKEKYVIISEHFINKHGKKFKNTQLANSLQKIPPNSQEKSSDLKRIDSLYGDNT